MKDIAWPWLMSQRVILRIKPDVQHYLKEWKYRADNIRDEEFRKQALASIESKAFHCECGAVYALLATSYYQEILQFIVAYQTISDYLDNLCDRSTSLNPQDFCALHESIIQALTPGISSTNYYRFRQRQDDDGYLSALVRTCQDILGKIPAYSKIADITRELAGYYCRLQVDKHVKTDERVQRLQAWFESNRHELPELRWYEFAASAGSTLGIFCLAAEATRNNCSIQTAYQIKKAYFPWVQGLHILLDYLIDQEEDRIGGDLNFCTYYPNEDDLFERIMHFYKQAEASTASLPNAGFHHLINRGLLGIYFADRKVSQQNEVRKIAHKVIRHSGIMALVSFIYCWIYRRMKA
jgi:tetraprenyl-beta-curcumene synthase